VAAATRELRTAVRADDRKTARGLAETLARDALALRALAARIPS
jgi:hypothetical protein